MLSEMPASRKSARGSAFNAAATEDGQLYDLLIALGFPAHERVSINTALPGGAFTSTLYEVHELAGWSPPQDRNVWFGVNPVGRHVRYGRGTEADVTRVRTLFADLDVKPGKQFDTLDQCHEAARLLEDYLGVVPVAVIESGHGLQPLWRIGSPRGDSNVVDRDRTRDEWRAIYGRWGAVVQRAAQDALWSPDGSQSMRTIDNVYDLSRVLRCPESVNWKDPDNPVPVRTTLLEHRARVLLRPLVARLDRDGIDPLASVSPVAARVPTDLGEAREWVAAQPGAELDVAELQQLPPSGVLTQYLDPLAVVQLLADTGEGAHRTMTVKVLHAVYAAQEGRAGLVVALNNLRDAYLEVMEARGRGELPGEARSEATAAGEVYRAVVGAVARARARGKPVVPDVDGWAARLEANR
jgi:hypothetical protein